MSWKVLYLYVLRQMLPDLGLCGRLCTKSEFQPRLHLAPSDLASKVLAVRCSIWTALPSSSADSGAVLHQSTKHKTSKLSFLEEVAKDQARAEELNLTKTDD